MTTKPDTSATGLQYSDADRAANLARAQQIVAWALEQNDRFPTATLANEIALALYERSAVARSLELSLVEMLDVYWAEGDGHLPEPACITRARDALAFAGHIYKHPPKASAQSPSTEENRDGHGENSQ